MSIERTREMPELAEVVYYARQWQVGLNRPIARVRLHSGKRIFRGVDTGGLVATLTGQRLRRIETHGKQIRVLAEGGQSLGLHLGMSGRMLAESLPYESGPHDHLALEAGGHALIFRDPRLFGRVRWDAGTERAPAWWRDLPPDLLSECFTPEALRATLERHHRAQIKAILLNQAHFPGLGNWMVDEILWRAGIHPGRRVGSLTTSQVNRLYRTIREVCADALEVIADDWSTPPDSWLFNHRWKDGGRCPKTGVILVRETVAGRTTCWSPACQKL